MVNNCKLPDFINPMAMRTYPARGCRKRPSSLQQKHCRGLGFNNAVMCAMVDDMSMITSSINSQKVGLAENCGQTSPGMVSISLHADVFSEWSPPSISTILWPLSLLTGGEKSKGSIFSWSQRSNNQICLWRKSQHTSKKSNQKVWSHKRNRNVLRNRPGHPLTGWFVAIDFFWEG